MMTITRFKVSSIILLTAVIFWPTFAWMKERFLAPESFYAHGFLVPLVSAYLIFKRKDELREVSCIPQRMGLILLISSLFVHLCAYYFEINFISGLCFVTVLVALILYNCGRRVLVAIGFPLFFLLFMVPMPQAMTLGVSFSLKLIAAKTASFLAALIIPLKNQGSLVFLPNGVLTVGAPCSGLRSLIALSALSLLFAYLNEFSLQKKGLFFILSLPIAFISNVMRIILLIMVFYIYGSKVAMGWFHDFSGVLVFVFAFLGLIILKKIFSLWPQGKTV